MELMQSFRATGFWVNVVAACWMVGSITVVCACARASLAVELLCSQLWDCTSALLPIVLRWTRAAPNESHAVPPSRWRRAHRCCLACLAAVATAQRGNRKWASVRLVRGRRAWRGSSSSRTAGGPSHSCAPASCLAVCTSLTQAGVFPPPQCVLSSLQRLMP